MIDTRRSRTGWGLAGLFVLTLPLVNPYLRGDGNGYYAYLRSAVIDRDLEFENEFRHGDPAFRDLYFDEQGSLRPAMRSATGRVINQWAVGPAILWLPFFLAAHGLVHVLHLFGSSVAADGFSLPYRWSCAVGTAVYGWLALMLMYGPASRLAGGRPARGALLAIWWASSLPVYMYFLPFHVHALAAFAVSLFLWYWLRTPAFGLETRRWAIWGALGGLMIDVYYLNAVVALCAAVELLVRPAADRRMDGRVLRAGVAFAAGTAIALLPHVLVKTIVHGSPLATGYRDEFFWTTPRWWQVGFSAEHGLFVWTPIVLVAVAGLAGWCRREPRRAGALIAAFSVFYVVVASYQNWHGLSSFGNRFFVSLTAMFVLGASVALAAAESRLVRARVFVPATLVALAAWNLGLMFQWGVNLVPNRGPVDFAVVARNQVTVVPQRLAAFAWRYLIDRRGLTADVEAGDRLEQRKYRHER